MFIYNIFFIATVFHTLQPNIILVQASRKIPRTLIRDTNNWDHKQLVNLVEMLNRGQHGLVNNRGNMRTIQKNYDALLNVIDSQPRLVYVANPDLLDDYDIDLERNDKYNTVDKRIYKNIRSVQRNIVDEFEPKNDRLIYITNPEVLEEYQRSLERRTLTKIGKRIGKTRRSSGSSSTSTSSESDRRRNLKEILRDLRKHAKYLSSPESEEFLKVKRRDQKPSKESKRERDYYPIEKEKNDDIIKYKEVDLPKTFNSDRSKIKSSGPKSHPGEYQTYGSKSRFDDYRDYRPKKESRPRNSFHSIARTSIPLVGKRIVYDN